MYRQYRDDGSEFGVSTKAFHNFFSFINSLHSKIKFTFTIGQNKLHYLGVAVEIKDKNLLKTETEYKSKDTFSHLIRDAH